MLAALIASQSLVAFVAAAPTPAVKSLDTLDNEYPEEVRRVKCVLAKNSRLGCRKKDHNNIEIDFAAFFLARHGLCNTINPTIEIDLGYGDFKRHGLDVRNLPMVAVCYFEARECGKLTKANFPNARTIDSVNALCYGLNPNGNCQNAIDIKQCNKFHANETKMRYDDDSDSCRRYPGGPGWDCERFWGHLRQ